MSVLSKFDQLLNNSFLAGWTRQANVDLGTLGNVIFGTALYQFSFYLLGVLGGTNQFTDFAGTSNFLLNGLYTYFLARTAGTANLRKLIVTTCVSALSVRLGSHLFYRYHVRGGDSRLEELAKKPVKYLGFFNIQGLWVLLTGLPLTVLNASRFVDFPRFGSSWNDKLGLAGFLVGFIIESVADYQKLKFSLNPENKDKMMDQGIWSVSRHPNYFGQILMWTSIYAMSLPPALQKLHFLSHPTLHQLTIISPLLTLGLLAGLSGVPLAEKAAYKKYNKDPVKWSIYQQYKARTSPWIPLPTSVYGSLPTWIKLGLFGDFWAVNGKSSK